MAPDVAFDRWRRIEELFHLASGVPDEERVALLEAQAGDDRTLVAEVKKLLASDSRIMDKISGQRDDGAGTDEAPTLDEAGDPWIGRTVGRFRILELLGRGGMGRVYRGDRTADDALRQTVAIKVIAQLLVSPGAEASFLKERDALARLGHRHIARLIDGGVTEEGLPYLAMEYVEGRRLDVVCDDPAATLQEVLALMTQLCEAVSYVHRNLLLHRDLKPGNVLVDANGELKLLDFGSIKSLGPGPGASAATQLGLHALTVRYASPEHIRGEDLSTASDVFSLGMTLYRVLLGHLPPEFAALDLQAYLQALREERFGTMHQEIRERWGCSAVLARDLEGIVRKALRFQPEKRYENADGLAEDLARAQASRPILANPATPGERMRRLLRRHRASVAMAGAAALLLSVALVTMLHLHAVDRAERQRAERGLADENRLTHFLLVDYFEQLKQVPGSTAAQKASVPQALAYADRLALLGSRPEVALDRVQAYTEMGSLLGNPYENNLADTAGGVRTLEKAVALARQLTASAPNRAEFLEAQADAEHALGQTYFGSGDPQKAAPFLVDAAQLSLQVAKSGETTAASLARAAAVVETVADLNYLEGSASLNNRAEAIRWAQQAQALEERGLAKDPACARCRRGLALQDWRLGLLYEDPQQAARVFAQGVATLQQFSPQDQATPRVQRLLAVLQQRVGTSELENGQTAEGLRVLRQVHRRLADAADLDLMDARAQFDLVALDISMLQSMAPGQEVPFKTETSREMLGKARRLVSVDPKNKLWQIHLTQALAEAARVDREAGKPADARLLELEGAKRLLILAQEPQASAEVLEWAADALVSAGGDPILAVRFATAALRQSPSPSAEQYVTLAEAKDLAGDTGGAVRCAHQALDLLLSKPPSVSRSSIERRARAVLARKPALV